MKQSTGTRNLLLEHLKKYPRLEVRDVFKFLYQSTFGCEHMVSSEEAVTGYIEKEFADIGSVSEAVVEKLDGDYSRVPLSILEKGLSSSTFGKIFCASSKKQVGSHTDLICKLNVARELVAEQLLPFDMVDFDSEVEKWRSDGFPAVRHSENFRETYKPSYRVISNAYIPFLPLLCEIDTRLSKGAVKLAVEGGSASGKSTLALLLSEIYDCNVFHMDDFFLRPEQRTAERFAEPGGNVDRERFLEEVLLPLISGKPFTYRVFDCSSMTLGESVKAVPKKLTVIEGAYSMHPELSDYYDFTVLLKVSKDLQRERIKKRNSPILAERFFNEWIPLEEKYFSHFNVEEKCDMVVLIK